MTRLSILVVVALLSASGAGIGQPITITNPIMAGFYPDPSTIRVGFDYYLINSTFAYFPGIPVFHSKDLKNWKQIGNVISRPSQIEGPHILKKSEWYYLYAAEGGTSVDHSEVVLRSQSVWGPYVSSARKSSSGQLT